MPWSGGVYTRGYASWVTDANNSLPISATKFDLEDNDLAAGLNNTLTKDGLSVPTATLNWAVQINWTRGSDGNIWSLARTGGANNPKIQASVVDTTGILFTVTNGNHQINAPALTAQGPVAAAQVDYTPDTGTFTGTFTGFTAGTTGTCTWARVGKLVILRFADNASNTSNANTFTMTGLPSAIQPATLASQAIALPANIFNNGALVTSQQASAVLTNGSGTITFCLSGIAAGWTNSGTKGFVLGQAPTIAYLIT